MSGIGDYRRAVARQEAKLRLALARGRASAFEIALLRVTWEIMRDQLAASPSSVLVWDRMGPDPTFGFTGADRWTHASLTAAAERISTAIRFRGSARSEV